MSWSIRRCGLVGATILVNRLTRQQHSQANSWKTIARETGMTTGEAELIYLLSVDTFLSEIDRRRIPDDYKDEALAA